MRTNSRSILLLLGALAVTAAVLEDWGRPHGAVTGEQVYVSEGCIHCHSQFSRAGTADVILYGPATLPPLHQGETVLIGNRRQGPDLANIAYRRSRDWNRAHLIDPRSVSPGSRMPSYAHLFEGDGRRGELLLDYLADLASDDGPGWLTSSFAWKPKSTALGNADRGGRLYAQLCSQCHGADGGGKGAVAERLLSSKPRDLINERWRFAFGQPGDEIFQTRLQQILKYGIPGTSMPGHEYLSDQQIVDLAAFVARLDEEYGDGL